MTRRWLVLGGLIALAAAAAVLTQGAQAQTPGTLRAGDIVLRGGWLFDATGDQAVRNTGIVVRNGALLEVGADSQHARPLGRAHRRFGRRAVRAAGVLRFPRALCGRFVRRRPRRRIHRQPGRLPRERRHVDVSGGRSRSAKG